MVADVAIRSIACLHLVTREASVIVAMSGRWCQLSALSSGRRLRSTNAAVFYFDSTYRRRCARYSEVVDAAVGANQLGLAIHYQLQSGI
jgi:hypothetical protein